jgi:hypothetical protein
MWDLKLASSGVSGSSANDDSHLLTEPLPKQRRAKGMTYAVRLLEELIII